MNIDSHTGKHPRKMADVNKRVRPFGTGPLSGNLSPCLTSRSTLTFIIANLPAKTYPAQMIAITIEIRETIPPHNLHSTQQGAGRSRGGVELTYTKNCESGTELEKSMLASVEPAIREAISPRNIGRGTTLK